MAEQLAFFWQLGGEGVVESLEGDVVTLVSTVPWPPGSPVAAEVRLAEPLKLTVKVHGSVRRQDGLYAVRGRLVDCSRPRREQLTKALSRT